MTLLNVSNSHLFLKGKDPVPLGEAQQAAFLAFPRGEEHIDALHERLVSLHGAHQEGDPGSDPLAKISRIGEPTTYNSFWNHNQKRDVVPVFTKRPYWVPDVSDALFYDQDCYTAEHDIPYTERLMADLAAKQDMWLLDSKGMPQDLSVLTYDIETTQFASGKKDIPIDVIGYSECDLRFVSSKDLETESFDFRFEHLPDNWADQDVTQLVSRSEDEELDHLMQFTQHAVRYDIISGHNVLGFDNKQIHDRLQSFLKRNDEQEFLSTGMKKWFETFTRTYSRPDRNFTFGSSQDIAVWYPMTLDTYHAARKFYFFHDDFSLKGLAPWLGIEIPERVYMDAPELGLDPKSLLYNKHDVQEQNGVTQTLLAQALPLVFTVNMPMHDLMTGGNTKMWDHMALIRARRQQKIMPATCRAQGVAQAIHRMVRDPFPSREDVSQAALALGEDERSSNKEFLRVAKQGPEMPIWCEHPGVVVQPHTDRAGSRQGYAIPGGLTLKPDSDLHSHFTPWFHVVEADVGAMYPTILKARNLTADTVRPAYAHETPDEWIWLFELDAGFIESGRYHVRKADKETDSYSNGRGWMIGVMKSQEPGLVNLAMTGVLDTIQKVKDARAEAKRSGADKRALRIHDMTYASLKAARNAGTHGIMVAVNVSCRQFNVWGGANITTVGQQVLHGTRQDFDEKGIRVVYGDTDGIYLGCSKSAGNLPHLAATLGVDLEPEEDKWITLPNDAIAAVQEANAFWRKELNYPGFELEAEQYDCMIYVVHKNYLKFQAKDGKLQLETKGNNFKGSDKAPLARVQLEDIMTRALRDVASWDDEEDGRERMKSAIKRATKDVMSTFKVTNVPWNDLILRQSVQPLRSYKPNPDGTMSTFAVRTAALEQVIGEPIKASRKFKFIICKDPLPLYQDPAAQKEAQERLGRQGHNFVPRKPKKSGIKPIEYMWPAENVKPEEVDWIWYKEMVENYIKGAFGFDNLELATQRDLSSWF